MTKKANALEPRVRKVASQILEISEGEVTLNLSAGSVKKWDSLGHLMLILAIENEFGVKFLTQAIPELRTIGRIIQALNEKLEKTNDRV